MTFRALNPKKILLLFCILAVYVLNAQKTTFRFFPIKELVWEQQVFVGKAGSHFFMLDLKENHDLNLYVFDTATSIGYIANHSFPTPLLTVINHEHSIVFVSVVPDKTGGTWHLLELDEKGMELHRKQGPLHMLKDQVGVLTNANKQHILFYQYNRKSTDSLLVRGTLIGPDWAVQKQLEYGFKQDADLDNDPEIFLDNTANTHIHVMDKFSNYRISSDLTVNTIPVSEDQIISETFNFAKVKLKNMRIFQNSECNCMQAEGLYVDGPTKVNKGIFSIAFPLGRKNELAPRFIPFKDEMIKNFRQGFSATNEMIQQNIELAQLVYAESGSFVILSLTEGLPQPAQRIKSDVNPSISAFNRYSNVLPGSDLIVTAPTTTGRSRVRIVVPQEKYAPPAQLAPTVPLPSSPLLSSALSRNAPKLIFIKLDKEAGFQWYTTRSLNVFTKESNEYNRLFVVGGYDEMSMILYFTNAADEPYPVWVSMQNGKQYVEKIPEKKLMISPVQFLQHRQYASLYMNHETGEGGLMIVQLQK